MGLRLRWGLIGVAVLVASLLAGLAIGPASLSVDAILADIASRVPGLHVGHRLDPLDAAVLWQIRAPRVILGAIVGGTLASAGAGYQAVFRNPLAEPYLLGVAAGAGLGATAEIIYGPPGSRSLLIAAAFLGALLAVTAAYALGRSVSGRDVSTLILAGIAVSLFLTAVQTFLLQQHTQSTTAVYSWLLGSLNTSGWSDVLLVIPYVAFSLAVLIAHRRVLDVLRLGDEEAEALGVNVGRVRLRGDTGSHARDRRGGRGEWADRFRGSGATPHSATAGRRELPRDHAARRVVRRVVPRARRHRFPYRPVPGGSAGRGDDGLDRGALLRARAARHAHGGAVIEAAELSVTLGDHLVVDRVSFSVSSGGWLMLIGPNGAGKSTALRALAGLVAL